MRALWPSPQQDGQDSDISTVKQGLVQDPCPGPCGVQGEMTEPGGPQGMHERGADAKLPGVHGRPPGKCWREPNVTRGPKEHGRAPRADLGF